MRWFVLAYGIYLSVYSFISSVSGSLERSEAMTLTGVGVGLIAASEIIDLLKGRSR